METRYYITVKRGKRIGWLFGPLVDEPTEEQMRRIKAKAERVDPWTHFDVWAVVKLTLPSAEHFKPGVLNDP